MTAATPVRLRRVRTAARGSRYATRDDRFWIERDGDLWVVSEWVNFYKPSETPVESWLTSTRTLSQARQYLAYNYYRPTGFGQGRTPGGASHAFYPG